MAEADDADFCHHNKIVFHSKLATKQEENIEVNLDQIDRKEIDTHDDTMTEDKILSLFSTHL